MSKVKFSLRWIARTAILLAVLIVVQLLLRFIPDPVSRQIITGSLVNFILLFACIQIDVYSGVIIGLISPVLAYFVGIQGFPPIIPFIILGNAVYVAIFALLKGRNPNWFQTILGFTLGALLKFALLALAAKYLVKAPAPVAQAMSIPQLTTALIGGVLVFLVELKKIFRRI